MPDKFGRPLIEYFRIFRNYSNEEIIKRLYIEWAYGYDETIHQSDIFVFCEEFGIDYDSLTNITADEMEAFGYYGAAEQKRQWETIQKMYQ